MTVVRLLCAVSCSLVAVRCWLFVVVCSVLNDCCLFDCRSLLAVVGCCSFGVG